MFDVQSAKKAGYTDAEIAAHLAAQFNFDLKGAKSAGYTDGEVVAQLSQKAVIPGTPTQPAPAAGPSIGQRIVGAGEAGFSLATGMVGGAVGMVGGTVGATAAAILDGSFGTKEAADMIEQAAAEGAQSLTYQPRTESGQSQAGVVGQAMQNLIPLAGLAPQMAMMGRAAGPAAAAATDAARAGVSRGAQVARSAGAAIAERLPGAAEQPQAARFGSVGAAGSTDAAMRTATAEALPVPIKLTQGQATRDFDALRFEGETAKNPTLGGPLRERSATQNAQLAQNFEALVDETGARATTDIETGRTVYSVLVRAAAAKKAEYRSAYKAAEKAGQMEDPVSTAPLVDFLAQNESLNQTNLAGGSLGLLQRELVRLGGAEVVDGQLVPRELPLRQMELLRRQMNNAIDAAPDNATNMRAGVQIRELIDTSTDGMGGDLYKQARGARRRYSQLFEDNAIVRDLLKTRRGTADRQVALEDVVRRTILNGDRASLSMLRRTLQVAGGEDGAQAWKELQGATVRYLLDESTKGVGTDIRGNPIFSAAKLNSAVRALDADGRLDFVLSKKGAQTVRDLNEISKVVLTLPPGSVNTSNTASVLLAALAEAGVSGSMTGMPLPILTGLRQLSIFVKDRAIRQRVQEALRDGKQRRQRAATPTAAPTAPSTNTIQ